MASRTLNVVISGDAKGVSRAFHQVEKDASHVEGRLKRFGGVAGKSFALLGAAAGGAAVVGLKKSAQAAIEAEKSQAKMVTQLKAAGVSYRQHATEIDRVIQKTSQLSGLDDEDLQDSFTNIVRVTGDVNKSLKLTGLAADFARAKHMDVAKAGELVGKVAGGNTGILSRYGITLDKGASSAEALAVLQQKFAGQAESYGKTTAGALDRAGVASENLSEIVGAKLTPWLAKGATGLVNLVDKAGSLAGPIRTATGAVADGFRTAQQWVKRFADRNRDDIQSVIKAGRNLATAFRWVFTQVIVPAVRRALPIIRDVLDGIITVIRGLVRVVSGVLTGDWRKAWQGIKDIVRGAVKAVVAIMRGGGDALLDAAKAAGKAIVRGILAGLKGLTGALAGAIKSAVKSVPGLIGDAAKGIGKALIPDIANPFGDGVGKAIAMTPLGTPGLGGGMLAGADADLAPFASLAAGMGLHTSSGLRPGAITSSGNPSFHATGDAIDESGSPSAMLRYFNTLKSSVGGRLRELIYTPGGVGIKDGRPFRYTGQVAADHYDHVHVAYTGPFGDGIGQIENLWMRAGGRKKAAAMAAAIAMAESSGQAGVTHRNSDGSIDRGLWQINSVHGGLSTTNRMGNARAAVRISGNGRNWSPWTTYGSGAYKRFLGPARAALGRGGSSGSSGGGATSGGAAGMVGSVTGAGFGIGANPNAVVGTGFGAGVSQFVPTGDEALPPTELDYLNAASAQAALTPGTADDLSAAQNTQSYAQRVYDQALKTGDPRIIGPAAEALKQATDAVTALTESITAANRIAEERLALDRELVDNQRQLITLTKTQGPQLIAGLTAILSGGIGGTVGLGFQTPGYAGGGIRY